MFFRENHLISFEGHDRIEVTTFPEIDVDFNPLEEVLGEVVEMMGESIDYRLYIVTDRNHIMISFVAFV